MLKGDGANLSLTAGATYVIGLVGGYSETASSQDLTRSQQPLGQFDTRIGAATKFDLDNALSLTTAIDGFSRNDGQLIGAVR